MTAEDPFSDLLRASSREPRMREEHERVEMRPVELLEQAQFAYVGAEERLNEFRAAYPEFREGPPA